MNCQELTRILDEQELRQLPAAERGVAEAHLASCPDCRRDLEMHLRVAALSIPPLAPQRTAHWRVLAARSQALAAAGTLAGRRQRARGRFILIGTLAAVAAAAAILAVSLNGLPDHPAVASLPAVQSVPPVVAQAVELTENSIERVAELHPHPSRANQGAAVQDARSFTVLVNPLKYNTDDPGVRSMSQQYYAAMLYELRAIPGLVLVAPEQLTESRATPARFRLTVAGDKAAPNSNMPSGRARWQVSLQVEVPQGRPKAAAAMPGEADEYAMVFSSQLYGTLGGDCMPADVTCPPAGKAAMHIMELRKKYFPADPALAQHLQARFLDPALPLPARLLALTDLAELAPTGRAHMNEDVIRGVLDLIASSADVTVRSLCWRALQGQDQSELLPQLITMSRYEPDATVRLEAVTVLARDLGTEAGGRTALETIARNDPKLLIRKVAERAVSGDVPWRRYVIETVKDRKLSIAQRFEPISWMTDTNIASQSGNQIVSRMNAAARELLGIELREGLISLLSEASKDPASSASITRLLGTISFVRNPAVPEVLLAGFDGAADVSVITALGGYLDDPRVRTKLENVAVSHPDPVLREAAASVLKRSAPASSAAPAQ